MCVSASSPLSFYHYHTQDRFGIKLNTAAESNCCQIIDSLLLNISAICLIPPVSNYSNKQTNKTNEAHCQGCFNPQRKTALSRWFLKSVTFFFFSTYRIKTTNCLHTCDEPKATCEYNHYSSEVLRSMCTSYSQMPWGGGLWLIQSERVSAPSLFPALPPPPLPPPQKYQ